MIKTSFLCLCNIKSIFNKIFSRTSAKRSLDKCATMSFSESDFKLNLKVLAKHIKFGVTNIKSFEPLIIIQLSLVKDIKFWIRTMYLSELILVTQQSNIKGRHKISFVYIKTISAFFKFICQNLRCVNIFVICIHLYCQITKIRHHKYNNSQRQYNT